MKKLKNLVDNQRLRFSKRGVAWRKIRKEGKRVLLESEINHYSRWFDGNKQAFQVGKF